MAAHDFKNNDICIQYTKAKLTLLKTDACSHSRGEKTVGLV